MGRFKVMIITIMSVVMILSGCEKDEVVPIAEKTTNIEQTTEQALTEKQDKQETTAATEEKVEEEEKEQESTEIATNINNSNDISEEVKKDEEKVAQEPTKETTEQKSNTPSSTNKSTAKTEVKEPNKAATTTQETQTSTEMTTNKSNEKQTETAKEQTTTPPPKIEETKQSVTLTIVGDQQQKGTILSSTKVEMTEGNTVLDVTLKILKQKGIPISVRGSGSSAYIEGIDNLYEFDLGPLSGWTVKRNGAKLDRSAGAIQVKNGDSIQWIYTSNYDKDGG